MYGEERGFRVEMVRGKLGVTIYFWWSGCVSVYVYVCLLEVCVVITVREVRGLGLGHDVTAMPASLLPPSSHNSLKLAFTYLCIYLSVFVPL